MTINTPNDLPEPNFLEYVEEPYISAQIITKPDYIGTIIKLCLDKRGTSEQAALSNHR